MPDLDNFADMITKLMEREMNGVKVRHQRIEEAIIAHLLDNGHSIQVTPQQLFRASKARYQLAHRLTDDGALEFYVADANGREVTLTTEPVSQ